MTDLAAVRRAFAEKLAAERGIRSTRVVEAFATVPREEFLPPGPWLVLADEAGYRSTPDADPRRLYEDMAVALDASRVLNNGAPGFLARVLDQLAIGEGATVAHIGCAFGYYTAILAEIVGPHGRVIAVELDPELCQRAQRNLRRWPWAVVRHADGTKEPQEAVDVVWVHGGVTHPQPRWLAAVGEGGRLGLPLMAVRPPTRIRRVVRDHAGRLLFLERRKRGIAARFGDTCGMQALLGGRDVALQEKLRHAYQRGGVAEVRSFRTDPHAEAPSCWMHHEGGCLSREPVEGG
jgi:protein-L-isoaspartate(D-aspartate) O-methyltransferase